MLPTLKIELDLRQAVQMDSLFDENKSIKKRSDLLSNLSDEYSKDQVSYLIRIILEDYLEYASPPNYSAVNKLLKGLDFSNVREDVPIILLKLLKRTASEYTDYSSFYTMCIDRFNELLLDVALILSEVEEDL